MITSINFNKFNYNIGTTGTKSIKASMPSFTGLESEDYFEKEKLTNEVDYKKLQNILNINGKKQLRYSKELLDEVYEKIIIKNEEPNKYEHGLGANLQKLAIRHYLLKNMPNASSFLISIIERLLLPKIIHNMSNEFLDAKIGAKELPITEDNDEFSNGTNNFYRVLSLLYKYGSTKFVYTYLKDNIENELKNLSVNDKGIIVLRYYNNDKKNDEKLQWTISETKDKSFIAKAQIGDKQIAQKSGKTPKDAKNNLLNNLLELNNISFKFDNNVRRIKRKYGRNEEAKKVCERALKEIGFFKENDKLNIYSDTNKIEYIYRALDLSSRSDDPYRFQILEFYGDATLNVLIGKYLSELKNDSTDKINYYPILQNNKTAARNAAAIGLYKHIRNTEGKEVVIKTFADAFEAMIGALTLSYGEDRVYEYLKPILEHNHNDAINYYKYINARKYNG